MNLIHIITSLGSGGTEKNLLNLIKFDNNKNNHIVFVLKPFGFYQKDLERKVKIFKPNDLSLFGLLKFLIFLRSFCKKNREKIDIIYSWNYQTNLISTLLNGKRKIWNIRSSGEKIYKSPKRFFYVFLNGFFSLFSDKIIFNSHKSKKQHSKFFLNKNITVIHNGFLLNKNKLKHKKNQCINYSCIARNDYYKDHKNLLKSFLLFDQKFKNWKLYIIGKGNENILEKYDLEITKEFKKKIIIVNETRNLKKYMSISHFHVLSSLGESFPNVVGETMSHGIINIGCDVGDTKYLIKDKDFLVKPESPEALFKSLLKSKKLYLENYPKYFKKCKNVKEFIYNNFKYLNYYQSFILEAKEIILKKFLFVLPTLNTGGAERVTTEIIKTTHLINKDIKTDLLVLGKKSNYDYENNFNGKIFYLNHKRAFFSFISVIKFINSNNYKFVFSNIPQANALMNLVKIFSIKRFMLIVRESNMPYEPLKHEFSFKNIFNFLLRFCYFNADLVVCPSKGIYISLKRILYFKRSNKFIHLPNYINLKYNNKKSKKNLKGKIYKNKFILSISNISFQKNIEYSLKIFKILLKKKPNFKLLIIGKILNQKYFKKLQFLIKKYNLINKVYFLGFQKNPYNIIKKAKLIICTSRWEGMPNSLLQSVSLNKKIVSIDCRSGPSEIKDNRFYINIIKNNNPNLFARKINQVLDKKIQIDNQNKIYKYNKKYVEKIKLILNYDF